MKSSIKDFQTAITYGRTNCISINASTGLYIKTFSGSDVSKTTQLRKVDNKRTNKMGILHQVTRR
jgi:hypothetical protein